MRKKISVILLVVLVVAIVCFSNEQTKTYSLPTNSEVVDMTNDVTNGNLTEVQMQNYVVSTAKQYFYKRTFTDYSQHAMDDQQTAKGYGTFMFRNFRTVPEELSSANYVNFDCSSFATNVYMNTFGYFFADYYNAKYTNIFKNITQSDNFGDKVYTNSTSYHFTQSHQYNNLNASMNNFYYGTRYNGKNTLMFPLATSVIEEEMGTNTPPKRGTYYNGSSNNNIKEGLIRFYYASTNKEGDSYKTTVLNSMKNVIKDGDIFMIRRGTIDEATGDVSDIAGHVMVYTDQKIQYVKCTTTNGVESCNLIESDGGFIHSSGYDYTFDDTNATPNNTSFGFDTNSVRYMTWDDFVADDYLFAPTSAGKKTLAFTLFRPINMIKKKEYTNYYNYSTTDNTASKGKVYVSKNTLALNELEDLRIEENAMRVDDNGNINDYISEYNSVNEGDKVHYRLCLDNMTFKTDTYNGVSYTVDIKDKIPANSTFVECKGEETGTCVKNDDGTISWDNVKIDPNNTTNLNNKVCKNYVGYTVKVNSSNASNDIFSKPGMKINKDGSLNELKMSTLKFHVEPTVDIAVANQFTNVQVKINSLITDGKLSLVSSEEESTSSNSFAQTIESISAGSGESMTASQIVKLLYYNVYEGMNIGDITNYESGDNGIFDEFADGNYTSYARKLNYANESTNNNMLIPGLYGGRKVRGNLDLKRESIIKEQYLEIGDLILFKEMVTDEKKYWIYLGKNSNGYMRFLYLDVSNGKLMLTSNTATGKAASNLFNKIYRKKTYAILRPNAEFLSKVNFIQDGEITNEQFKAIGSSYGTLPGVSDASKTAKITYDNNGISTLSSSNVDAKINNVKWYKEKTYETLLTETSKIDDDKFYDVYAKETYEAVTLPTVNPKGYSDCSWNSTKDGTGEKFVQGSTYSANDDTTFYADCKANNYKITFDSLGAVSSGTTELEVIFDNAIGSVEIPDKKYTITYDYGYDGINKTEDVSYKFKGYYTEKNGQGIKYFDESGKSVIEKYEVDDDLTLYAHYEIDPIILSNFDGRKGYTFNAWYKGDNLAGKVGDSYLPAGDEILTANWTANNYKITFENGGENPELNVTYDSPIADAAIPEKKYTITYDYGYDDIIKTEDVNYKFKGYYTGENGQGTKYYDETGVSIIPAYTVADNLTLYAYFEPQTVLLSDVETREGYEFTGWKISGDEKEYKSGDEYTPTTNVTFVANWEKSKVEISSDKHLVDENNLIISDITIGTTVNEMLNNITTTASATVKDKNGVTLSNDSKLKTGDVITFTTEYNTATYEVSVAGDVTGNGKINVGDIAKSYQFLKNKVDMTKVYQVAADLDSDGIVAVNDTSKLYAYLKGKITSFDEK